MGAFLLHTALALREENVAVRALAPHAPNLADEETLAGIPVHRFHYAPTRWEQIAYRGTMHEIVGRGLGGGILFALFNLGFLGAALRQSVAIQPAILHAHWWIPGGVIGACVAWATGVPLVITTHGTDVELLRQKRWAIPLARFAFARARAVTCGSQYLRAQLLALDVVAPARVHVIPMPIHSQFETPNPRRENPDFEILAVARLTAQKSLDTLIAAVALVRERGLAARVKIIGDGPARAELQARADALNLQAAVTFLGTVSRAELLAHYAQCAVFVLPSIREGLGLVLAEALLCGAPVVAANSGGVTDIVRDGETGLLFAERDARALADALEKLWRDRALAARLAATGATWVRARFAGAAVAAQFAAVYQTLAR